MSKVKIQSRGKRMVKGSIFSVKNYYKPIRKTESPTASRVRNANGQLMEETKTAATGRCSTSLRVTD